MAAAEAALETAIATAATTVVAAAVVAAVAAGRRDSRLLHGRVGASLHLRLANASPLPQDDAGQYSE